MPDLIDLQAQQHADHCHVHRIGSTDHPWCSCGRNQRLVAAGSRARRDGPSTRPNWDRGKR